MPNQAPQYYSSRCSLPSAFELSAPTARSRNALSLLKVEGLKVRYVGPGEDDSQAATVRANYPVPADLPLFYFEVTVVDKGTAGYIGIGLMYEDVNLAKLPGWDAHSYGYHGDDGNAFSGSGRGRPYGPPYTTGDVIGVLFSRLDRTVTYFKNGVEVGVAFTDVNEDTLYPCVGMRTRGEELSINFGRSTPFKTDFLALRAAATHRVQGSVASMALPLLSSRGTSLVPQLVHDYLMHHRYWQTAGLLARDLLDAHGSGMDEAAQADVAVRQRVYELLLAGSIDNALQELQQAYSQKVLDANPALMFRLRVQKFVQMVEQATASSACCATAMVTDSEHVQGQGEDCQAVDRAEDASAGVSTSANAEPQAGATAASDTEVEGGVALEPHSSISRHAGGATSLEDGSRMAENGGGGGHDGGGGGGGDAGGGSGVSLESALQYARAEVASCSRTEADSDLLQVTLAEDLNGAILAHRGLPAASPLERCCQQAAVTLAELKRMDHAQALLLPDVRQLISQGQ